MQVIWYNNLIKHFEKSHNYSKLRNLLISQRNFFLEFKLNSKIITNLWSFLCLLLVGCKQPAAIEILPSSSWWENHLGTDLGVTKRMLRRDESMTKFYDYLQSMRHTEMKDKVLHWFNLSQRTRFFFWFLVGGESIWTN